MDHVPPRSCKNKESVIKIRLFPGGPHSRKEEIQQGGLHFSYICSDCNNAVLGARGDKELSSLFHAVLGSGGPIVSWQGDIGGLIKSVFGHILATDEYSEVTYDQEMRDFILRDALPAKAHLYLLYYPYKCVFIIHDALPFTIIPRLWSYPKLQDGAMVSCLYFYPLAFIVTDPGFYKAGAIDLTELYPKGKQCFEVDKRSFRNQLIDQTFPPDWPCSIGGLDDIDMVDCLGSGREGEKAQFVLPKSDGG